MRYRTVYTTAPSRYFSTAADLGMFSMFGRTGALAPHKKGPPQKERQIFACGKMGDPE